MDQNRVNITVTATDKGATATLKGIEATGRKSATAWGSLGKSIAGVAAGIGLATVAASAWTATLGRGFNRLADLEDANKRLKQMGLEIAEIDALSKELQSTLVGTPYALNEGANAMTRLVAAGIDLQNVPTYFRDIVDAAAFSQSPIEEVADIFVKIQSEGRVTSERLNQLTSRGIPAFSLLASAIGVTGEQLRVMLRRGEVSSEMFFAAWHEGAQGFGEDNIVMAGSAQSMGDTTRGALANAGTAFGRLGANLLEKVWPAFRVVADGARETADALGRVVDFFQENRVAGAALVGVLALIAGHYTQVGVQALWAATMAEGGFIRVRIQAIAAAIATNGLAGSFKALMVSIGPVGILFAVAGVALSLFASKGQGAAKVNQELVDSLDDMTGALTRNSREIVYNALVESGAVKSANELGISLEDLTDAALGNEDATARVNDVLKTNKDAIMATARAGIILTEEQYATLGAINEVSKSVTGQTGEVNAARDAWAKNQEAMGNAGAQASTTGDSVEGLTEETEDNAETTDEARQAIENYQSALRAATDPVFAMVNALQEVRDAQAEYDAKVAEFGGSSAEATEAALALAEANLGVADAANNADLSFDAFTEQLDRMVSSGQLTAQQADLIRQSVDEARGAAEAFDSDYVAEVRAHVDTQSVTAAESALSWLARQRQSQINPNVLAAISRSGKRSGGIVGHAAEGGPRNGPTLVGEDGPEFVNLGAGTHVTPAGQTASMLGQGGGGVVTLRIESGGSRMDDLLVELIRKAVRAGGGNAQTVLGT